MSESKDLKEFPDLSNKLAAPAKKSLFEKQRAEAEAKRLREEAETAAVLADFVKSFDEDEPSAPAATGLSRPRPALPPDPRVPSGPPKRHFTSALRNSGPGTLDGPPTLPRKRALDGTRIEKERGIFAFEDSHSTGPIDAATAFRMSDDEDEKAEDVKSVERAVPKPTLQLSSLPPGTSPAVIKSLLPDTLTVDSVRVLPPSGPGSSTSTERKSMSAIVTFDKDTPASDLDVVVSTLTNKYLGWGYNLSLSRHLSSAALGSVNSLSNILHASNNSLPFGAQAVPIAPGPSLSRAPPPGMHRGGYAPPSSYEPGAYGRGAPPVQVKVAPPSDIRQLKLIHKTLENLLTHGPEFEALLMSRPEVQREERWAWIWDPRSPGGVWYRWRLWGILTGSDSRLLDRGGIKPSQKLFDGGVPWVEAEEILPFEFATKFDQFISDSDYNSSDEDDSGDEKQDRARRRYFQATGGAPPDGTLTADSNEPRYLNPLQKAKFTHLLARLPTTTAKLRKGDVARVTAFAISHAGQGADEVVDMLISNIMSPYARSRNANPERTADEEENENETGDGEDKQDQKENAASDDISGSTLIALHLISDILSASSTSGVRHAWRFRSLFESCFQSSNIFAYLGCLEKIQGWGRLRAEKWRRSVAGVLSLWESWCVFPGATHERFVEEFNHPPMTEQEIATESEKNAGRKDAAKSKWKSVPLNASSEDDQPSIVGCAPSLPEAGLPPANRTVHARRGETANPQNTEKQKSQHHHDNTLSHDSSMKDVTNAPMEHSSLRHNSDTVSPVIRDTPMTGMGEPIVPAKRRRPKAEDMFAEFDAD